MRHMRLVIVALLIFASTAIAEPGVHVAVEYSSDQWFGVGVYNFVDAAKPDDPNVGLWMKVNFKNTEYSFGVGLTLYLVSSVYAYGGVGFIESYYDVYSDYTIFEIVGLSYVFDKDKVMLMGGWDGNAGVTLGFGLGI